ncbi:MAG: TetR/AcrR family transcriptional regulator [Myxococcota bacterium]
MPRPREYDEDQVLELAMAQFWSHGYEATSMSALMEATGLAKGSLYKGFGDKHQLFVKTLVRYLERGRHALRECIEDADDARAGLRRWLEDNAEPAAHDGLRRGCFAVNTAVELAPHDAEIRRVLRDHERRMEKLYQDCVRRGIEDGSLRADLDPPNAARWITTVVYGLQVRSKLGMSHTLGLETAAQALDSMAGA